MAAEFEAKFIGAEQVSVDLGAVPAKVKKSISDMLKRMQYALVDAARSFYDQTLESRSGALKGSIQPGDFEESDTEIRATVVAGGGKVNYARQKELGGTITAKNVKNLTIPLAAALTPMGVSRFSAREVISDPTQFGFTGTFFSHGLLLGTTAIDKHRKKGTIGGVVPLFILKPSVTQPEHPFMRPALKQIGDQLPDEAAKAVAEATR